MCKPVNYFLFAVLFCCSYSSGAQNGTSSTITKGPDVNFIELAKYFAEHPTPLVRRPMFDEDGDKQPHPPHTIDPSQFNLIRKEIKHTERSRHTAYAPSPAPADTFSASVSNNTSIPPDTHGAVDSTYCISALNDSVVIRYRTGAFVSGMKLDDFWSGVETHGTGAYDPRIHYDPNKKRWIFVTDCYGESIHSSIFVAVSATGDPTGTWHTYSLYVGNTSGVWLDFPCVGFNNKWVAVSGNFFDSTEAFTNDVVYVFNYSDLMSGATSLSYSTLLPTDGSFCVAPALTYDSTEPNLYTVESWNGTAGEVRISKISGTVGSPSISIVAYPTSSTFWQGQGNGGSDFAPQSGTTHKLQTNDDRINNLQQRNGNLWFAHTAFLPASGTVTHSAAMWWETDTSGSVLQNGMVNDASASIFYAFPSIAVNSNNDALMGFAYFSSSVYPSAAYSLHMHSDASDTMRTPVIFRHGQLPYYQTYGGSDNRWGDYSGTCIDPRNNLDFWTTQESVPNYGSGGLTSSLWDTWWGYVQICTFLTAPTADTMATTQCAGTTATYSVNPVAGATSYTWTISGTGWSGTSTTNSIALTAGTGVATISAAANNTCGAGAVYTFTVTGIAIPSTPVITSAAAVCAGATGATFSATSATATSYSWQVLGTGWSGTSTTGSLTATVGTGTGEIIATGINVCGSGLPDTLSVSPGTGAAAATTITAPSTICSGSSVTFTTPAVSGATNYTWSVTGSGWSGTSTTNSLTATAGTSTATITVTPDNACGNGASFALSVVPVITPVASFTIANHTTYTSTSDVFNYSATAIPGADYTWNFGAGSTAVPGGTGAGPQTVTWSAGGLKTITLSVSNGSCTSAVYSDTVLVLVNISVPQLNSNNINVTILPNPNDGTFDILFDRDITDEIKVSLIDMQGKIVYDNKFVSTTGNKLNIVTNNLIPGTYTVSIMIKGVIYNTKITITK